MVIANCDLSLNVIQAFRAEGVSAASVGRGEPEEPPVALLEALDWMGGCKSEELPSFSKPARG